MNCYLGKIRIISSSGIQKVEVMARLTIRWKTKGLLDNVGAIQVLRTRKISPRDDNNESRGLVFAHKEFEYWLL